MSLSSLSSHYALQLSPHAILLQKRSRAWWPGQLPRVQQQWQAPVSAMTAIDSLDPVAPWQAALQAAAGLLARASAGHGLQILLSNHWLRYKLLPAMPPMLAHAQAVEVARQALADSYGEIAHSWAVRLAPLPYGDSQLCCALDQALLEGLHTMADTHGLPLTSVQPALMQAFNRIQRHIGQSYSALAQVETGRVSLALLGQGSWLSLSASTSASDWPQALLALLQRERLLSSSAGQAQGDFYLQLSDAINGSTGVPVLQAQLASMGWRLVDMPSHTIPYHSPAQQAVAEAG